MADSRFALSAGFQKKTKFHPVGHMTWMWPIQGDVAYSQERVLVQLFLPCQSWSHRSVSTQPLQIYRRASPRGAGIHTVLQHNKTTSGRSQPVSSKAGSNVQLVSKLFSKLLGIRIDLCCSRLFRAAHAAHITGKNKDGCCALRNERKKTQIKTQTNSVERKKKTHPGVSPYITLKL